MKLLPYVFKWIGIGLFFLSMLLGFDDFCREYLETSTHGEVKAFEPVFPEIFPILSDYVLLFGLLLYILAKNKTEDEFFQKLRYESAFLVLVLTIGTVLVIYIFNSDFEISPSIFLTLQMVAYLLIRMFKRSLILTDNYEQQS